MYAPAQVLAGCWLLAVAGVFFGFSTPMIFAIGATLAGPRAAGRWAGAQNLAGQLAGILAPVVTGFIVDRTGRFTGAFAVAAAAAVVSMVAWGVIIRRVETCSGDRAWRRCRFRLRLHRE
jgi:MFS family permease